MKIENKNQAKASPSPLFSCRFKCWLIVFEQVGTHSFYVVMWIFLPINVTYIKIKHFLILTTELLPQTLYICICKHLNSWNSHQKFWIFEWILNAVNLPIRWCRRMKLHWKICEFSDTIWVDGVVCRHKCQQSPSVGRVKSVKISCKRDSWMLSCACETKCTKWLPKMDSQSHFEYFDR